MDEAELPTARWGERFRAYVAPDRAPWVPATQLFGAGLADAVAALAEHRGLPHRAAAGVLLVEHYAQRVVAPVLAAFYEDGCVLDARLPGVRLEFDGVRIARVGFPDDGEALGPDDGRRVLGERLFAGDLDLAVAAVHDATRAGRRVLRGAVAHAVTTAFLALSWPHPDPSHHLDAVRDLLARQGLADLVTVDAREVAGERWLYAERRTCCLAFRAGAADARPARYCATCPVVAEPDRRASFVAAASTYRERRRA